MCGGGGEIGKDGQQGLAEQAEGEGRWNASVCAVGCGREMLRGPLEQGFSCWLRPVCATDAANALTQLRSCSCLSTSYLLPACAGCPWRAASCFEWCCCWPSSKQQGWSYEPPPWSKQQQRIERVPGPRPCEGSRWSTARALCADRSVRAAAAAGGYVAAREAGAAG